MLNWGFLQLLYRKWLCQGVQKVALPGLDTRLSLFFWTSSRHPNTNIHSLNLSLTGLLTWGQAGPSHVRSLVPLHHPSLKTVDQTLPLTTGFLSYEMKFSMKLPVVRTCYWPKQCSLLCSIFAGLWINSRYWNESKLGGLQSNLQLNLPHWIPTSLFWAIFATLNCITIVCLLLLQAFRRSDCSSSLMSLRLIPLIIP